MAKKTYQVTVRRDGRFWYISIPDLDGATQARRLTEVDEMARDYIATVLEVPEDTFDVAATIELPSAAREALDRAERLHEEELTARAEAAAESRRAVKALKDEGLTVREIGLALGISHQRAQQLANA